MKQTIRILCMSAAFLLLITACRPSTEEKPDTTPVPAEATPETVTEDVVSVSEVQDPAASSEAELPTAVPTVEPTAAPTVEPTEAPASPAASREGDITDHFPDYDTGVGADYSYQSDSLRIAINVYQTTMRDHLNRDLNETYYVADIWIRSMDAFRTVFANGEYGAGEEEGDAVARRENAIFAVNGSYNQGLTLHAGTLYRNWRQNKGWNSGSIGVIYKDGTLKTFQLGRETFDLKTELENGAWHAWQFGPIVIRNYEAGPNATKYSNMGFKARNILGYYEPGHYVIVTCDQRGEDARGMNEYMMVDLMKSLGVKEAFNLDGGTSAVMVFMGEIINHPTLRNDNGTLVEGRGLLDMLVFGEYDENGYSPDLSTLKASKFKGKD